MTIHPKVVIVLESFLLLWFPVLMQIIWPERYSSIYHISFITLVIVWQIGKLKAIETEYRLLEQKDQDKEEIDFLRQKHEAFVEDVKRLSPPIREEMHRINASSTGTWYEPTAARIAVDNLLKKAKQ